MNAQAMDRMVRNKNAADGIGVIVDEWLEGIFEDSPEISIQQRMRLENSIEAYLNKRDSE